MTLPMTIKATIACIKALSPDLTVRWLSDSGEYRVSFSIYAIGRAIPAFDKPDLAEVLNEALAYYTDDAADAYQTARAMLAKGLKGYAK